MSGSQVLTDGVGMKTREADRQQGVNNAFKDVRGYPEHLLQVCADGLRVPVSYRKAWNDGFGARGWKLDATIGDPEIIASTRETGERIHTSVFIHDILDHFLSGFGVSGHRSEAMALVQLANRTGSDPAPDYAQMVREDIMRGRVNGESLRSFLPRALLERLPAGAGMDNRAIMHRLSDTLTPERLETILVEHFFEIGGAGRQHAVDSWSALGLDREKQAAIGLALQALLEEIDWRVEAASVEELHGWMDIDNHTVAFSAEDKNASTPFPGTITRVAVTDGRG